MLKLCWKNKSTRYDGELRFSDTSRGIVDTTQDYIKAVDHIQGIIGSEYPGLVMSRFAQNQLEYPLVSGDTFIVSLPKIGAREVIFSTFDNEEAQENVVDSYVSKYPMEHNSLDQFIEQLLARLSNHFV